MDLQQQKEVLTLYYQYQDTDKDTLKINLKTYMDINNIKPAEVSNKTGIKIQTVYQLRKFNNEYKPDFMTALIICHALKISILSIMQKSKVLNVIPDKKTKWTKTAKQNFIKDYNNLDTTSLCKKYNITPRTAQEYNRIFSEDLDIL